MMQRLRNGFNVWRYLGTRTFFRLVLFKLGLTHTHPCPPDRTAAARTDVRGRVEVTDLVDRRFQSCARLSVFQVPPAEMSRISVVTDSINSGSLYGGVGTAMILGALLTEARHARLRIVTRTERARPSNLNHVLHLYGIEMSHEVEFAFAPAFDGEAEVDMLDGEEFITTSWWTTAAALDGVPPQSIIYLLQEDERTFYPYGDDRVRCSAVLGNKDIRFILNTRLLFDHLVATGLENLTERGMWFEPAFPREVFHPRPRVGGKRKLVFYARPNNLRNLFHFGIDVLDRAISRGVVDTDEWDVLLVGKDVPDLAFSTGYVPARHENLPWADYAELAGATDIGFSLMSSVHPSYPPLDFAASGAVVLTNRWGAKQDLSQYSRNILCADLDPDAMTEALSRAVDLATDERRRADNYRDNGICTDWRTSFRDVVARLTEASR